MKKKLITIVFGTRPEAIKFAPLIMDLRKIKNIKLRVILTGQHKEMVEQVMDLFEIKADVDFEIMKKRQTITHITSSVINILQKEFEENIPDLVLVQGDTSSAFAAALSAFYHKIPVGHLEAGLRTNNLYDPFPEELNRRLISQIATLHFAPSEKSLINLKNSNVSGKIINTGNTVIDAMKYISEKSNFVEFEGIDWQKEKIILLTTHRRENIPNLEKIAKGVLKIINNNNDVKFIIPLHKNLIVREKLKKILSNNSKVFLTEPLNYDVLVGVIKKSYLVLTDSGGLQEEAPTFGKPVLVIRDTTERIEAIEAGVAKLIGTDSENIFFQTNLLLDDMAKYNLMSKAINPFGIGKASSKIIEVCKSFLKID